MLVKNLDRRMPSLKEFMDGLSIFLKSNTGTIVGPRLRDVPAGITTLVPEQLQDENVRLRDECKRYRRKTELLLDLRRLGPFSWRRKREIFEELTRL